MYARSGVIFTKGTHLPSAFSASSLDVALNFQEDDDTGCFLSLILENREIIFPGK